MATSNLTGAPVRADHAGDTAPLPPAAVAVMARLERAFAPVHDLRSYSRMAPEARRAVIRYENASARTAELSALMDSRTLTVPEFDSLEFAQDTMADARATLAAAGLLRLIEAEMSEEHSKTKPPLPPRPRGPHPYRTGVA